MVYIELRDDVPSSLMARQISTSSRKESIIVSRKEEALKRLHEREERLAEFQARKERENAHLKAEREIQAKAKLEYIKRVKEMKEKRRLDTLRKISEREKRAEDILKQRRTLYESGRGNGMGIGERIYDMLGEPQIYYRRRKKSSKKSNHTEGDRFMDSDYFDFDNNSFDESQGNSGEMYSMKGSPKLRAVVSYDESDNSFGNTSQSDADDSHSDDRENIFEIEKKNLSLKSSLSKAIDTPFTFVVDQILSHLQRKVIELEKALSDKSDEITRLERDIASLKTKCVCAAFGLTLLLCCSGMHSHYKMKQSKDAIEFMKVFPTYLKNFFKG